ncbi:MAG: PAS domain S-box protein, partial [Bacteroidota bacterium]|nr:PAS domain S-box protein [Bacteroidota bacterium]
MVWIADVKGIPLFFNLRWREYTGQSREDALVNGIESQIHPDCYDDVIQKWKNSIESGSPHEVECLIKRAEDGSYRWHLFRALPQYTVDGGIGYWLGTCVNIHDNQLLLEKVSRTSEEMERKMKERNIRLGELEAIAHVGSWEWDVVTDTLIFSEELWRIFGYTDDRKAINYYDFILSMDEENAEIVDNTVWRTFIEPIDRFETTAKCLRRDGNLIYVHCKAEVYRDNYGQIIRMTGISQDVTERVEKEEALKRSESIYRNLAANLPGCVIIMLDKNLRLLLAEGALLTTLGYSSENMLGKSLKEVLTEKNYSTYLPLYQQVLKGKIFTHEYNSESGKFYKVTLQPVYDDKGKVDGAMAVAIDISNVQQAQDELRHAKELSENIISHSIDGINAYDRETRFVAWNAVMEAITGVKAEDVIGKKIFEAFPHYINTQMEKVVENVLRGEQIFIPHHLSHNK